MIQSEYIIAFSSFYKAAYAEEILGEEGIKATLRKLPIEIANSCSTGLVYRGENIEKVKSIFEARGIHARGIYMAEKVAGSKPKYVLVR